MRRKNLFFYNENQDMGQTVVDDDISDEELDKGIEEILSDKGDGEEADADENVEEEQSEGEEAEGEEANAGEQESSGEESEESGGEGEEADENPFAEFLAEEEHTEASIDDIVKNLSHGNRDGKKDDSGSGDEVPDFLKKSKEELMELREEDPVAYDLLVAKRAQYELNANMQKQQIEVERNKAVQAASDSNTRQFVGFAKKLGVDVNDIGKLEEFSKSPEYIKVAQFAEKLFHKDEFGKYPEEALSVAHIYLNRNRLIVGAKRKGSQELIDKLENGKPEHGEPKRSGKTKLSPDKDIVKQAQQLGDDVSDDDLDRAIEEQIRRENES